MALFSNNISRLFENNPVNQVGPTGQPLLGGSNITDLATRSLGGLLGREVRGRPEQLTAALSQIDPKAPDAQEQQLRIVSQLGNPQQQLQAMQKIKADKEKTEEKEDSIDKVANMVATRFKDNERVSELISLAGQGVSFKDIVTVANEKDTSSLSAGDRFKVVKGSVFDVVDQKFIAPPEGLTEEAKRTQVIKSVNDQGEEISKLIDLSDGSLIQTYLVPTNKAKMGQQAQIQLRKANESYSSASSRATQANSLATNLEQLTTNLSAGFRATIEETIKGIAGSEDIETLLRVQAQALRISVAVSNLPPGPASDKDVKLVLSGTLPNNADPATLASYARGIAKLATKESKFHSDQSAWISKYKDAGGYLDYVTSRNYDDKISYLNQEFDPPPTYNTFLDYAQYLSSKGTSRSPQEELELVAFENEIGESVTNMFERRDSSKRRLKESKRDKF